jgi:hypothetical protein
MALIIAFIRLGKLPLSLSVETGGTAVCPTSTPSSGWMLGLELSPIFSFHVGPREKICVGGKSENGKLTRIFKWHHK